MTIINPNSIAGITSVTAEAGVMNFYKSDGTLAGLQLNGVNFNTTAGVSTFNDVYVGGTITYEDVKNVDSVGVITARDGVHIDDSITHIGDTNTKIRFPEADNFTVECAGAERFRVKPTNDVAVFTGSNSGTLTIRNDTSNEMQLHTGGSDALIFGTGGENERLRITSAGLVGLGIAAPTEKLHVIGQVGGTNPTAGSKWDIARFVAHDYSPTNSGGLTIGAYWHNTTVAERKSYIQSSQSTDSGSTARALLLNPDGGSVGIGTDAPGTQLHLYGSTPILRLTDTDTSGPLHTNIDGASGYLTLDVGSIHRDVIITSANQANEIARFTGDGNVGISEASPQALLHLNAGANSAIMFGNTTHGYKIRANVTSSHDYGLLIEDEDGVDLYRAVASTGSSNADTHTFFTAGTERLRIHADGEVEIKPSVAGQTTLSVQALWANASRVHIATFGRNGNDVKSAITYNHGTNIIEFGTTTNHATSLVTNNIERLRIDNTGKVGIGKLGANRRLHVASDDDLTTFTGGSYGTFAIENSQWDNGDYTAMDFLYNGTNKPVSRIASKITSSGASLHFGVSNSYSTGITHEAVMINYEGSIRIGAGSIALPKATAGGVDIASGSQTACLGGNVNSSGRTNSTDKLARITSPHYTNAEESVMMISAYNQSGNNNIGYGGGSSTTNTATQHTFYTAADTTTTNGTERLRITSDGYVGVKRSTPLANLHTTNNELAIGANPTSAAAPNATYDGLVVDGEAGSFINIRSRGDGNSSYGRVAFSDDTRSRGYVEYRHKDGGGDDTMRFATLGTERMRIDGNGKIIVATGQLHSTRVLAKFGIDCQGLDIYDGVGVVANYGMAFYNDPNSNKANGIGFFNDDGQTCGGYIVHQDKGSGNLGDIIMATSATSNTPVERLRITSAGSVRVGDTTNSSFSAHAAADDLVVGATSGSNGMTILTGAATGSIFFNDGSGNEGVLQYIHSGAEHMRIKSEGYVKFDVGGGTDTVRINDTGRLGVGSGSNIRAYVDAREAVNNTPLLNFGFNDGSFYRHLGTVGPSGEDGRAAGSYRYLHVRLRTVWNDASMTMFRITGYTAYNDYTESYFGCYRYNNSGYRTNPYGQIVHNQKRATLHSAYNTGADPGYLVLVLDSATNYIGYMIEHIGAGGAYASYMQQDLEIIDTKRDTTTSDQWPS